MLDFIARVAFLCWKELLMLVKDPKNRALILLPALLQSLLFGYGATYDLTYAPYAVLDQSGGAASTRILSKLAGTGIFHPVATLRAAPEIADVIDRGDALLVISFPADFESRLAAGQPAPLQMILDGRNSSTAGAAAAQVGAIVAAYNQERGAIPPITIERRAWFNPNLESRWNILPALIAALSMLQTLLLAALSVAREREQGTFD
ncbi:MAG TPA: ABC transporter permease, partial [Vicinamibacterales bacterium]